MCCEGFNYTEIVTMAANCRCVGLLPWILFPTYFCRVVLSEHILLCMSATILLHLWLRDSLSLSSLLHEKARYGGWESFSASPSSCFALRFNGFCNGGGPETMWAVCTCKIFSVRLTSASLLFIPPRYSLVTCKHNAPYTSRTNVMFRYVMYPLARAVRGCSDGRTQA